MDTGSAQPRRADLLSVRALLDEALIGLRSIGDHDVPLLEARQYVSAALARVYEALAHATDLAVFRERTAEALQLARDALSVLSFKPSLDPAVIENMRLVAQAIGELNQRVYPPEELPRLPHGEHKPPIRASVGEPTLHDPQRDLLFPTIPLPALETVPPPSFDGEASEIEPPPKVETADDLAALAAWGERVAAKTAAEAEEKAKPPPEPVVEEPVDPDREAIEAVFGVAPPAAFVVFERARGFFDDIGMMSLMRRPVPDSVWFHYEPIERRLLARIDAILACGTWVVPRLVQLLEDRPIPDPEMLWASIFVLGCVHGDDTRDQIERQLRLVPPGDEVMLDAAADALRHAPHRGIEPLVRRWLESPLQHRLRTAIRVLGHRRATMVETLRPYLRHADPLVVAETLAALERVPGDLEPRELDAGLVAGSERLFRTAAETATARGFEIGVSEAVARLRRGNFSGSAAMVVAVAGDENALDLLLEAAATNPTPEVYSALGWYGSVAAVPFLLGRLEAGETAAVLALQRLTGASLTEDDPSVPEYAREELPFLRLRWVAPTAEGPLCPDLGPWAEWWMRYGHGKADPHVRYRWGHRWSTRDNLYELERGVSSPADRRTAWLELCARTGGTLPFEHDAFVVRQRAQIASWAEYLGREHARARAGHWPRRFLR